MHKTHILLLSASLLYPSFTSTKTNKTTPSFSYSGNLTTLKDRVYPISNITIAKRRQCIPVFKAPCNPDTLITHLTFNPKEHATHLNLKDIANIESPYPYAKWLYRTCDRRINDKYLLIKVSWHEKEKSASYYLISPKTRIQLILHKKNRSSFTQIPFSGIKNIAINPAEK